MKIITILKKSFVKDAKLSLKRDNDFFFSPLLYWIFSFFGSIPKKTNAFIGLLKPNHNNRFNFNAIGVLTLVLFFGGQVSWGQVNISSGNTVSQNFNTIGATATATLPTGWKVDAQSASRTFGTYSAAGTATVQTIGPAMSATATSGIYNYGSGTNNTGNDRAIGGLSASSSNRTINLYVDLLNNGASTIGSYSISYNIEKYRTGTLGMTIQMYYSTDGSTWTTAGVNFSTSPTVDGSVAAGPATVPISSTSVTSQLLSVTTTASSHLYLMWSYSATTGTSGSNAQALGIDDITISAASSSVNPTFNTYSNVTKIYGDGAFDMTASSNSSGTIAYSSSNTGVASINSSTGAVTITGVGSTTITASQAAATGYNAGSTTATLTVSKGNSSITATGTSTYIYNGTAQGPASNTKSGSTGAVTYSYSGTDSTTYAASATAPTAVGTYQVIATVAADSNYNTASSSALAFSITKGNSSITATGTSTYIYNGTAQGPASNTKSGSTGAVTYSYSETGSTTYAASATAPTAVGTYQVIATVAEDANYNSASSSPLAFSISQKALTITGLTAEDKIYDESTTATISGTATLNGVVGSEDVTLTGSPTATFASSAVGVGISVAVTGYSLTGADVANYTLTQPTLSASIISNTPTLFASGTLAAVNATYGSASATPSSFSVSAQSLTNAISVTAPTGFEVSLSSASDYAASVTFGAAGNVSSTNVYVRLTATNAIGSYSGNIEISSTDATTLTVATASSTVSQKQLTISGLTGVDKTYNNSTDASVSGTAELIGIVGSEDVSLNSSAATYAFANANVGTNKSITVLGYALNGTASSNYTLAQPSGITASINKADQTISAIAESQTISFGDAPYSVATTATSGLTVAYSSSNTSVATVATNGLVTIVGAGTATITASQSGNSNYNAATPVTQVVTVAQANQTITAITSSVTKTYGDATYSVATTATSGLTVTYSSDNTAVATVDSNGLVTIIGVGIANITAAQDGNTNYSAAVSVSQELTVSKASQTITFNALTNKTTADSAFNLTLNASSGLPITYTSSNTAVATISGNTVTILSSGSTTITASQDGNAFYDAATSVSQVQTILTPIVKWSFDSIVLATAASASPNITTGSSIADIGVQPTGSVFSANHASAATLWTTPAGNGTTKSATSDHWAVGDYYQFKVNTSNYRDLALSFDSTGSATGPNAFKVQYSLTGTGTFTDLPNGGYAITADSWSTSTSKTASNKSFDLSALTTLNNKSAIYIRLTCNSTTGISSTFGTGGTNRVDNLTITGVACDTSSTITTGGETSFCSGGSVTLTASSGSSYLWSNGATTQSISATNSANYSVTVTSANGCSANSESVAVTVTPNVTPTFSSVAAICTEGNLSALPTISNNSIEGTWSPALDNTTTTEYTFTPTAGQCATAATLTITVNPIVTPTFSSVSAICSGASLTALPTTSNNSIIGAWSPALDNTVTTEYTFTPTAGQCATAATLTITVNPNVTPTFDSVDAICSGASLTALPTTSNNFITGSWSPALANTATTEYTFTPTAGQCATAATLTITVNPNVTPTFSSVSAICSGASLTALPTTSNNSIEGTWSPALVNTATTEYTFTPTAGQCATTATLTITVNNNLAVSVAIASSATDNTICAGTSVTFTASPVHGGDAPTYQWKKNGENVEGATSATYQTNSLLDTDKVTVVMTSNETGCHSTLEATSNEIETTVNNNLAVSVAIASSATDNTICAGTSVTFTASPVHGGEAPTYQWKKNGENVEGATSATYQTNSLLDTDKVTVVMTSNETGCHSTLVATSNEIETTVNDNLAVSVAITSSATDNTICAGTSVTFTASPVHGGEAPTYQWKKNDSVVDGETTASYTTNSLLDTDKVTVVMTSNETGCHSTLEATSNEIETTVNDNLAVSVAITSDATDNTICAGTSVIFTAAPTNGGDAPTYQWKINGADVDGATEDTFTPTNISNGQIVSVVMTSSEASSCLTSPTASSNNITFIVKPVLEIATQPVPTNICISSGTATISVIATGASTSGLSYEWQVKSSADNSSWTTISNDSVYNNSNTANLTITNEEGSLALDGNLYKVIITDLSDAACVATLTSDEIALTVNALPVAGAVFGKYGEICPGTSKTLSNYNGRGSIQWQESLDNSTYNPIPDVNTYLYTSQYSQNKYIRVVRSSGACPNAITNPYIVGVSSTTVAGTISGGDITICSGENFALTLTNSSGNVQWQQAIVTNGVPGNYTDTSYTDVTFSNAYSASTAQSVRLVRAKVSVGGGCSTTEYTDPVTITILKSVAGSISGSGSICEGDSKLLTLGTHVGSVQWQSFDGATWNDIAQANGNSYSAKPSITTSYRVKVTSGSCTPAYSKAVIVNVNSQINAGTITEGDFSVCSGVSSFINLQDNTSNAISWYKSVNGDASTPVWTKIINTTTLTLITNDGTTLKTGNLTVSTWYKATMTNGTCSASTPVIKATVTPVAKAGTITTNTTSVCLGSDITFTLNNNVGSTIQWQSAPIASGTFNDITDATSSSYTLTNATATSNKSYKAIVTSSNENGVCSTASVVKTITVNPLPVGGNVIGGGTVCSGSSSTLKISGSVGTIQWEYSTTGDDNSYQPVPVGVDSAASTFTSNSSTRTSTTYLIKNITDTTYFRARLTSGVCTVAYSNEVHYTVGDALAGDLLAAESTVCSANGGTNLTLGASTGIVAWYKSTNYVNTAGTSAVWTLVPLSSTVTSTALATGNLTYYAATPKIWYKAVATAGSCSSTSNIVSVTISRSAVATAVTGNAGATTLAKAVCSGVKTLSLATGSVGTIQWQFYNAGTSTTSVTNSTSVSWTDIDSATATTLSVVSSDAGNIWFRAKLTNSPCATSAYSTPVNVWIKACGSSVRVDDSAIEFKASAYPNPFAENFKLDVKTSSEEALQIKVYDMLGKLVDNKILETSEVEGLEIGSNYTTGVYNVIVTQGDNVKSLRVIKR